MILSQYYYSLEFDFKDCTLRGKTILDFGCGSGIFSLYTALIAESEKVYSLDEFEGHGSDPKHYEKFQRLLKTYKLTDRIELIKANGIKYDFKDLKFDVIYFSNVLHHLFPRGSNIDESLIKNFFEKIKRLLKPKGTVVAQEVMRYNIIDFLPSRFNYTGINWKTKLNASEWLSFFRRAGFKQNFVNYFVPYHFRFTPLKRIMSNAICSFFLLSRYTLVCR